MPDDWKDDWKNILAIGVSLLLASAIMIFMVLPIQFFQQHLLISGILFAVMYIVLFFAALLGLKKEERIRVVRFFKKKS